MTSREYFAQVAGDWDRLRAGFFSEAVREAALKLAGLRPGCCPGQMTGQTAADLGAGTGFVTEALLQAGLSVAAVDQSPQMLAELRAKFGPGRTRGARLTTHEGTAEALPLPDASVDFVFANMFLHHVDDPAQAIAEMARVLRPGGHVVLTDLDSHGHAFLLTEHHDRWPGFARAEVASWLQAAGLVDVRVADCRADSGETDGGEVGRGEVCCAQASGGPCSGSASDTGPNTSPDTGPSAGRKDGGELCCADSCNGAGQARISIFAAHGVRPLCAIPASQADPLAVGARARALFAAAAPLLCAESVLPAVAEALRCDSPPVPRLATGFCSGLSRTCGPCGALSGGIMALGLGLGRDSGREPLDRTYAPVQEYLEYFRAIFQADTCRELTGCDLGTPEGQQGFGQRGVKENVCLPLVAAAAAQVVRILAEHQTEFQANPQAGRAAG